MKVKWDIQFLHAWEEWRTLAKYLDQVLVLAYVHAVLHIARWVETLY